MKMRTGHVKWLESVSDKVRRARKRFGEDR